MSLAACTADSSVAPAHVTLVPATVACAVGERVPVRVDGSRLPGTITVTGRSAWLVDAHPERGTATLVCEAVGTDLLSADVGGAHVLAPVTVNPPPLGTVSITLAPQTLTLVNGASTALAAAVSTTLADAALDARYASSDTAIVVVDSVLGIARATGIGTATITARARADRRASATTAVTVTRGSLLAVGLSVSPSVLTLALGRSGAIAVFVQLARDAPAGTSRAVAFTSDDPTIATVSPTGIVTGVGQGTTTITMNPVVAPLLRARVPVTVFVPAP